MQIDYCDASWWCHRPLCSGFLAPALWSQPRYDTSRDKDSCWGLGVVSGDTGAAGFSQNYRIFKLLCLNWAELKLYSFILSRLAFTYLFIFRYKVKRNSMSSNIFSTFHPSRHLDWHCFHSQSHWSFSPHLWICTIFVLTIPRPAPCSLHPRDFHPDFPLCPQYPQQWPNCHPTSWSTDSGKMLR